MAFIKLQFTPGVNRDQTDYSNEGGWYECDKIRFRSGYPQKIGGWQKLTPTAFIGVCRQMWNWITTFGDNLLALGTNNKLYIENGGYFYDITPLRDINPTLITPTTDNCVSVTSGSNIVSITATNSAVTTGNFVVISGVAGTGSPAAIGGIPVSEINGNHEVTEVNATTFTFTVTTAATSNVASTGGTAIVLGFEYDVGNPIAVEGLGWGAGTWGRDAWGLGAAGGGVNLPQTDWWLDNFDNDLVANIRNGPIFWWERGATADPQTSLATKAIWLKDLAFDWATADPALPSTPTEYMDAVPSKVMQTLVSQQDKHLLAFGAVPFGFTSESTFDPLLIRWADQDTPENWIPGQTTTAGDLRVSRGSKIVRALPTRQEILVWTDTNLYTLQFTGTTDVFSLQEYADNISIMSPRAMASASNITYWMGQDKFYAYTGRVETLPCTLRNHVFGNFNFDQSEQVVSGTNEQWNEIWWFYPTSESDYNDAYVVYNYLERIWYYGTIDRTAWLDSPLRRYPQAANTAITVDGNNVMVGDGYLYEHESSLNDDGVAMISHIRSSDFDIGDGDQFMLTRRLIPDLDFTGSAIGTTPEATLEIRHRNFPGSALQTGAGENGTIIQTSVGQYTTQIFVRARARQMALKIMSDGLGVQWQLGAPRLDAREDGKR
jgi:hypothetical protein